jgi:hypothetical protein
MTLDEALKEIRALHRIIANDNEKRAKSFEKYTLDLRSLRGELQRLKQRIKSENARREV